VHDRLESIDVTRLQPHDAPTRAGAEATVLRSSGRLWLVIAFVAGLIYVAALLVMRDGQVGISTTGIVVDAAVYVAMIVTRITVHGIPARLGTLAAEFLVMSLVSLVCLVQLVLIAPIS
jgi:hypothetical protein